MATHSSTLAWKIPWEEPGRLQSMGLQRVGHDWTASLSPFIFMHWRRKWQPTPVFLPGESQGRGSLVGCHLWGRTESDTTEATWAAAAAEIVTLSKVSWTEKEKYDIFYVRDWKRNNTNELIYKTETDSQTWRMNLQIPGWRVGEGIGSLGSACTHCCN